jgi:hypothetical protein
MLPDKKAMSLRSLKEYLKFRFFIQNNFTYMKVLVKRGLGQSGYW